MYLLKRIMIVAGAVAALAAVALAPGATLADGDDVTMNGRFVWEREDKNLDGDLRAVFTPTGDGTWNVAFHFDWEDGPHVYSGTATGSLTEGALEGEVENDNDERNATFRFRGDFEDGTLNGTHVVVGTEGEERATGSFTLSGG